MSKSTERMSLDNAEASQKILQNMQALGHKGGLIGGPKRAKVLSASERSSIASQGADARWGKR